MDGLKEEEDEEMKWIRRKGRRCRELSWRRREEREGREKERIFCR